MNSEFSNSNSNAEIVADTGFNFEKFADEEREQLKKCPCEWTVLSASHVLYRCAKCVCEDIARRWNVPFDYIVKMKVKNDEGELIDEYVILIPPAPAKNFIHDPKAFIVKDGDLVAIRDNDLSRSYDLICKDCAKKFNLMEILSAGNVNPLRILTIPNPKLFTEDDVAKINEEKAKKGIPPVIYYANQSRNRHSEDRVSRCCHCCFDRMQVRDFYHVQN